jgi:hypothetical protein
MSQSINGTGTMWYGRALTAADGSYVVTEWITFFWLPLIPLGSKRVIRDLATNSENAAKPWFRRSSSTFYKTIDMPTYWPHVIKAYSVAGTIILAIILLDHLHI